jgi:hypothetical protein
MRGRGTHRRQQFLEHGAALGVKFGADALPVDGIDARLRRGVTVFWALLRE